MKIRKGGGGWRGEWGGAQEEREKPRRLTTEKSGSCKAERKEGSLGKLGCIKHQLLRAKPQAGLAKPRSMHLFREPAVCKTIVGTTVRPSEQALRKAQRTPTVMGRSKGVLKHRKEPGILGEVWVQLCPGHSSCSSVSIQPCGCETNINICFPSADLSVLLRALT